MIRNAGFPALAAMSIAAVALLAACGGGSGTTTTVRTVGAVQPTKVIQVFTNIPEVDQVASAAVQKDKIELAGLTGYQKAPCTADAASRPADPPCRDGEADGTVVEVLAQTDCLARTWVRPELVPDAFAAAFGGANITLFAAYRPKAGADDFGAGEVLVFSTGVTDPGRDGVALHINQGRVVLIDHDCQNISELVAPARVDAFIVEPKSGAPTTAATTPPAP